jgi:trimeric autotransporter adhesin
MTLRVSSVLIVIWSYMLVALAQSGSPAERTTQLVPPPLIQFSGVAMDEGGNPLSGAADLTFSLYADQHGIGSWNSSNALLGFSGNFSMTGGANTAIGAYALYSNTTGGDNTASGSLALQFNTTGWDNTATGAGALEQANTGNSNTAGGTGALQLTTSGSNNTGFGYSALAVNSVGSNNTALSYDAGPNSINLNYATAIGANSVVSASNAMTFGASGAVSSGTGQVNVGIGTATPAYRLDVSYGDMIVRGVQNFTLSGETAYFYLGDTNHVIRAVDAQGIYLTSASASGLLVADGGNVGIGTTTPDNLLSVNGSADKPGGGSWGTFSDLRLKTLDGSFNSGLSQVLRINPVRYRYKEGNAMGIGDREEHVGLVAQDVQKVIPEAVTENSKGYLLVNNDPIIWAMLNAIKEQQWEISAQQRQIRSQRSQIARVTRHVGTLEAELRTVSHHRQSSTGVRAVSAHNETKRKQME